MEKAETYMHVGVVTSYGRIIVTDAGWIPDFGYEGEVHFDRLRNAHEGMDAAPDTGEFSGFPTFCGGLAGVLLEAPGAAGTDHGLVYPVLAATDDKGQLTELMIDFAHPQSADDEDRARQDRKAGGTS